MSITLTIENSHRTFFVIAIRIAGIKCVNRGKRITGIQQAELHRRRGGSFRCHQVFGIEILVGFAPAE